MKLTNQSMYILSFYVTLVILWFSSSLFATGNAHVDFSTIFSGFKANTQYGYIFNLLYGFLPFFGGILGISIAKRWGMFKSSMGKAIFFLSMGSFIWSIGAFIWAYYNFVVHAAVPYPGFSDVAWIACYPFWGLGVFYLGQAMYIKLGLRKVSGKLFIIILPIIVVASSWYFLVDIARGGSITSGGGLLKVFFDIAYPTGDVLILTLAFLIFGFSFLSLGGRYKWPIILILFGFLFQYLADFAFSYTTTINTYYNGDWVDLLYATSLFILSFGLTLLDND